MKVQEKMKIGIFQPNINNHPNIDSKLIKLEEILNHHDLDLLVLPELFFYQKNKFLSIQMKIFSFLNKKFYY